MHSTEILRTTSNHSIECSDTWGMSWTGECNRAFPPCINYVRCGIPVRHIPIPGEAYPHSWWWCAFSVRMNHNGINILTENGDVPYRKRGCSSPEMHILTRNEDVTHRECISSPWMGMCLTGNGYVTHRECTSSPGMHILTRNARSLYRVIPKIKLLCIWAV